MGNLFRILSHQEMPVMLPESSFDNLINADIQHTLESIKKIRNESQPVCMTHKRLVDQICLYERCRESERFMCPVCKIRNHQNHEEHFVSIYDFKNDLLQYINERRQERISLLNSFKKPQSVNKGIRQNQSIESTNQSEQNILVNQAISSSSIQEDFYDSLAKQLQKTEKLSEQFILEGLVNDIDVLINKIRKLNKTQYESRKASNQLFVFNQTFQNIFKNFILKKNLSEAKIFWSQHDLINEINSGINDDNFEMSSQALSAIQQQHHHTSQSSNRSLMLRQVLSKKNSRGLQTSASSYPSDRCSQNLMNTQRKRKQKQQQPFLSLIKFFEKFEHKIIDKLSKQKITQVYSIIYLNQNYCLIAYSASFNIQAIGLYDLVNCKLVKSQRIDFNSSGLQNHYEFGLFQLFEEEMQMPPINQSQIYHTIEEFQNYFIEEPIIQQNLMDETEIVHSVISNSDEEDQPNQISEQEVQNRTNHLENRMRNNQNENEGRNNQDQNQQQLQIQEDINENYHDQQEEEQDQALFCESQQSRQRHQSRDSINRGEEESSKYSIFDQTDQEISHHSENQIEVITINSASRKASSEISEDQIAVFSPIIEDTHQQDGYDSELDNLKNMFASSKEESFQQLSKIKQSSFQEIKSDQELEIQDEKEKLNLFDICSTLNPNNSTEIQNRSSNKQKSQKQQKRQLRKLNNFKQIQQAPIEEAEVEEDNDEDLVVEEKKNKKAAPINKLKRNKQSKEQIKKDKEFIIISDSESSHNGYDDDQEEEEEEINIHNKRYRNNQQQERSNQLSNNSQSNLNEYSFLEQHEANQGFQFEENNDDQFDEQNFFSPTINQNENHQETFFENLRFSIYQPFFYPFDYSIELNFKPNFNILVRNQSNRVIQIEKSNLVFKRINFQNSSQNSDIFIKEKTIQTKNQIKQAFSINPLIICICEKRSSLTFLFSYHDSLTFYNTRTKKMIKKINNLQFNPECIKTLRLGKSNQFICFTTFKRHSTYNFIIYNWKTEQEVKRFELKAGATFENMRILIEFYYQMYQDLDFDSEKVCIQIGDKMLQNTNFQENSLQYCIPYYCQNQEKKYYQLGICYLHNKILKSIPFSIQHINLEQGISQMFVSNDQLVIILKNGEIHHCHVKSLSQNISTDNQVSSISNKNNFILIN